MPSYDLHFNYGPRNGLVLCISHVLRKLKLNDINSSVVL